MNNDNQFIRDSQIAYNNLRKRGQQKMENIRTAIYQQRHSDFTQIRRQRDINDAKVRDFKDKVIETKRDQSLKVKEGELTSKMRYTQYHATRAKEYQRSHQLEASFQDSVKRQRQLELSSLESLEQEVLSRLKKTQNVEQKAVNQLEEALELSPTDFLNKYNKEVNSPKKRIYSVGKRRNTPSRSELLQDIQLNLKSNLDESFRLNLSSVKSTRNDKYLHDDWMNKDERIMREQRIYGGGKSTPKGSILEKLGVPKISNLNRSMYDHNIRGTEVGGKTSGRKFEKYRPMSRNKSLGTEVTSGSENRIDTEHDRTRLESREKYLSASPVKSRGGSRNNVDKLKSPSNQAQNLRMRSNLIGSRQAAEKGRSRAGSHVSSQITSPQVTSQMPSQVESKAISSKTNVEKEQSEVTENRTIEKEQEEINIMKENDRQGVQSESKSSEGEQPQSQSEEKVMEIEKRNETIKEESKAELEKFESEGIHQNNEKADEPIEAPVEPTVEVQEEKKDESEENKNSEKEIESEKVTETVEVQEEKEENIVQEEKEVVEEQNQPESS